MTQDRRKQGLRSQARRAASLGEGDPRGRRDAAGRQDPDLYLAPPLALDRLGRISLGAVASVSKLPSDASDTEIVERINELIDALQAAGIMET